MAPCFVNASDITPNAASAVMIDYNSGDILYEKNKDERRSVASLTKMMGLLLIFEKIEAGKININEFLVVSRTAKEMGGTQIWLEEGEKISVDDLLKGVTMASANDAMVLLAERASGSENAFVEEMNKKAKVLNLKNTHFENCTGFDSEGAYSSAYDMSIIAKELIKHKKVLSYTGKYEDYIRENSDNKSWIVNTNKLVKFYPGVDGLKTGYEEKAGSTIAVTSLKNGLRLIAVSLGYSNTKDRNTEAMNLLDYGYSKYEGNIVFEKGKTMKKIKVPKSLNEKISLNLKDNVIIVNKKGEKKKNYTYDIEITNNKLPLKRNDVVGKLILKSNDRVLSETPLITNKDVNSTNFLKQYLKVLSDSFSGA